MKKLAGTKTEENLRAAFAGKNEAGFQFRLYARKARDEGYEQIADIFEQAARNENAHGRLWHQLLNDGPQNSTLQNLRYVSEEENREWTVTYQDYAGEAEREGFAEIARLFRRVAKIERQHEMLFRKLLANMETGTIFEKESAAVWQCRNCGNLDVGMAAPKRCPVCSYPQGYFQLKSENY